MAESEKENGKNLSEFIQKKLMENRTVFICGEVTQELAQEVSMRLLILKSLSDEPITIFLNSQGGHVESGDTIHDMIKYINVPVRMIATGWVASAGTTIFLSVPKECRYSLPNTRFMIHQPSGGVRGGASDIVIEAEEILRIRKRVEALISEATGQPLEKVSQDMERDHWMDTKEALDYGIISKVITVCDEVKDC